MSNIRKKGENKERKIERRDALLPQEDPVLTKLRESRYNKLLRICKLSTTIPLSYLVYDVPPLTHMPFPHLSSYFSHSHPVSLSFHSLGSHTRSLHHRKSEICSEGSTFVVVSVPSPIGHMYLMSEKREEGDRGREGREGREGKERKTDRKSESGDISSF